MPKPNWKLKDDERPLALLYVEDPSAEAPPDIESLIAAMEVLVSRQERKVVVVDLTYAQPDAVRRRRFVTWAKAHWASLRNDLAAVAAIAPGALQRSVITSVLWFVEPPCPTAVFEKREAALAWGREQLRADRATRR